MSRFMYPGIAVYTTEVFRRSGWTWMSMSAGATLKVQVCDTEAPLAAVRVAVSEIPGVVVPAGSRCWTTFSSQPYGVPFGRSGTVSM